MKPILTLFSILALSSCSEPNIIVLDSSGKPIEGASVSPITLSMAGSPELTNKNGEAKIDESYIQATQWVNVTKAGFIHSGHIEFNQTKPIKIILRK